MVIIFDVTGNGSRMTICSRSKKTAVEILYSGILSLLRYYESSMFPDCTLPSASSPKLLIKLWFELHSLLDYESHTFLNRLFIHLFHIEGNKIAFSKPGVLGPLKEFKKEQLYKREQEAE